MFGPNILTLYLLFLLLLFLLQVGLFRRLWLFVKEVHKRYPQSVTRASEAGAIAQLAPKTASLTTRSSSKKPELTYEQLKARIAEVEAKIAKDRVAKSTPVGRNKVGEPATPKTKRGDIGRTNPRFCEEGKRMTSVKHNRELGRSPLADENKTLEDIARGDERWFELYERRDHHDTEEESGYRFHSWRYGRIIKEIYRLLDHNERS